MFPQGRWRSNFQLSREQQLRLLSTIIILEHVYRGTSPSKLTTLRSQCNILKVTTHRFWKHAFSQRSNHYSVQLTRLFRGETIEITDFCPKFKLGNKHFASPMLMRTVKIWILICCRCLQFREIPQLPSNAGLHFIITQFSPPWKTDHSILNMRVQISLRVILLSPHINRASFKFASQLHPLGDTFHVERRCSFYSLFWWSLHQINRRHSTWVPHQYEKLLAWFFQGFALTFWVPKRNCQISSATQLTYLRR